VKQVLVVDDSHVIRRLVEVVLEQIQLDVVSVSNGVEACEALEKGAPDVLILDVGLPDISGWDILDLVRSRPDFDGTVVIMLTGHVDAADTDRAEEKGANEYLTKPFRPADLRRLVLDTIHGAPMVTP